MSALHGGKTKQIQIQDIYHFSESHKHGHCADRSTITENLGFEPMIIVASWLDTGMQICIATCDTIDDWATRDHTTNMTSDH